MKEGVGEGTWEKFSGELYARVLELTRDEAQRMVRNEGAGGALRILGAQETGRAVLAKDIYEETENDDECPKAA